MEAALIAWWRFIMVPIGFDQTNHKVEGLSGDDGGVLAPRLPETSVQGVLQRILGAQRVSRGSSAIDSDPSVTAYSEEGSK